MYFIPANITMYKIKTFGELALLCALAAVYCLAYIAAGKLFPKLGVLPRKLIASGVVILFGALLVLFVL